MFNLCIVFLASLIVLSSGQRSTTLTFWKDLSLADMCVHISDSYNESTDTSDDLPFKTCDSNGLQCLTSSGPASRIGSEIYCALPYNNSDGIFDCLDSTHGYFFLSNSDASKVGGSDYRKNAYNQVQFHCTRSDYCSCQFGEVQKKPSVFAAYDCSDVPKRSGCCQTSAFSNNVCMFNIAFTAWKYGRLWRNALTTSIQYSFSNTTLNTSSTPSPDSGSSPLTSPQSTSWKTYVWLPIVLLLSIGFFAGFMTWLQHRVKRQSRRASIDHPSERDLVKEASTLHEASVGGVDEPMELAVMK
jgi:hypothetical protein